jgi:BASS family bile acid:Na+ symporter
MDVAELMGALFNAALVIMIVATMFAAGLATTTKALGSVFRNILLVILVLITAFVLRPLVGWGVTALFPLGVAASIVMLLLASVPGAPLGVKFAMTAKADLTTAASLQVLLAVIGSFTFAPTANFLIGSSGLGDEFALPVAELIRTVVVLQIIPFVVGMAVRHWTPDTAAGWRPPTQQIANYTLLIVIVLALLGSWRIILDMFGDLTILAHTVFIVIMVVLGYFISRGDSSIRKGTGLLEIGTTVLVFVQIVVGTLIASWFGRGDGEEEGVPVEAPPAEAETA